MVNLFRIMFWLALAFAVTMAVLPQPPQLPGGFTDKLQHMAAFATLAVLGALGYPSASLRRIGLGLVLVGAGIEVVQMIPALNRDADVMDVMADSLALVLALPLVAVLPGRKPRSADLRPAVRASD